MSCIRQLGRSYECEKMAHIDALAESEQIPANYLVQILNELRTAGLVVSKRVSRVAMLYLERLNVSD